MLTNAVLVINIINPLDIESFLLVEVLFVLKDSLIEELLQFLITVVDAELLKAVFLEIL